MFKAGDWIKNGAVSAKLDMLFIRAKLSTGLHGKALVCNINSNDGTRR